MYRPYYILLLRNLSTTLLRQCPQLWGKPLNISLLLPPGTVVGISDWLRAGRSGDRIPVWARFSAPVQTGPWAHPASCTMSTGSSPVGKERPGRDADPSPPSSAVVKKG
jgi:hypothetical protein